MSDFFVFPISQEANEIEPRFLVVGRINNKCLNCEEVIPDVKICPKCSYDLSKGMAPENLSKTLKEEIKSKIEKSGFGLKVLDKDMSEIELALEQGKTQWRDFLSDNWWTSNGWHREIAFQDPDFRFSSLNRVVTICLAGGGVSIDYRSADIFDLRYRSEFMGYGNAQHNIEYMKCHLHEEFQTMCKNP